MERRDFLKKVLGLAGIVSLTNGCSSKSPYAFNGEIDGEYIRYFGTGNLTVIKKDENKVIKYIDNDSFWNGALDKKLEAVEITENKKTEKFRDDEAGREVIKEAQKQFDNYLNKILEYKKQLGLDLIKQ